MLADNQIYRGYTLFVARRCVGELHLLPAQERAQFLADMATVAEAVFHAFRPRKLNYEMLGNSVPHLHWHLIPRYADDPKPEWPIWSNAAFLDAPRKTALADSDLRAMRDALRAALGGASRAR